MGIRLALRSGAQAVWVLNNDTLVESAAAGAMYRRLFPVPVPGCAVLWCVIWMAITGAMPGRWTVLQMDRVERAGRPPAACVGSAG